MTLAVIPHTLHREKAECLSNVSGSDIKYIVTHFAAPFCKHFRTACVSPSLIFAHSRENPCHHAQNEYYKGAQVLLKNAGIFLPLLD